MIQADLRKHHLRGTDLICPHSVRILIECLSWVTPELIRRPF